MNKINALHFPKRQRDAGATLFQRAVEGLESELGTALERGLREWAVELLKRARRKDLLFEGFFPLFGDGSLLEGSRRREGTKFIEGKGEGLLWTAVFAGPLLCAQRLAGPGEGEQSCLRALLPGVVEELVKPLGFQDRALLLADSLHGNEPSLKVAERLGLRYVVGANQLGEAGRVLHEQPATQWLETGPRLRWSESAVCVCRVQCAGWPAARTLVGRRWVREGEMIASYAGVLTNLTPEDVRAMLDRGLSFAEAVWRLYDHKGTCEGRFKDLLEDLGLHHPPCGEHVRNAGFYAAASLAGLLGSGVDLLGGRELRRRSEKRLDGRERRRAAPKRMRLWRLRRRLFSLPARIARHARQATVTLLGLSERLRLEHDEYWRQLSAC